MQLFLRHTKRKLMLTYHLVSQKITGQPKRPGQAKWVLHKQTGNIWLQNTTLMSGEITEVTEIKRAHRFTDQLDSKP